MVSGPHDNKAIWSGCRAGAILRATRPATPDKEGVRVDLAEAEHFLTSIETVECCFPDTWGVLTGRRLPKGRFLAAAAEGLSMPNAPFAWDIDGHIEPLPYANPETGYPNMHVVADLSTLR